MYIQYLVYSFCPISNINEWTANIPTVLRNSNYILIEHQEHEKFEVLLEVPGVQNPPAPLQPRRRPRQNTRIPGIPEYQIPPVSWLDTGLCTMPCYAWCPKGAGALCGSAIECGRTTSYQCDMMCCPVLLSCPAWSKAPWCWLVGSAPAWYTT